MAQFVRLEAPTGDARWVNPDLVQFVSASDDGLSSIHFSNEHDFAVKGTPEEVAGKLAGVKPPDAL